MNTHTIRNFKDLHVWQDSYNLALEVYSATNRFPSEEKFGLTSQIRRSVISVSSNIAEGFGRATKNDKRHFYTIAKGSLLEVENQLLIAKDLGYISEDKGREITAKIEPIIKMLVAMMKTAKSY